MSSFDAFYKQQYLNLETFRKSGVGVKTPVWFVQDGDTLYVRTDPSSGKVKRIRNNSMVNIAPCKMNGKLVGEWQPAIAREVIDEQVDRKIDQLLFKKYRLLKKIFFRTSSREVGNYAILEIKDTQPSE